MKNEDRMNAAILAIPIPGRWLSKKLDQGVGPWSKRGQGELDN